MPLRLRILAGPNGSGKTSVYQELREKFHWGVFVNADEIETCLRNEGLLDLREYGLSNISQEQLKAAYDVYFSKWESSCKWNNVQYQAGVVKIADAQCVNSYFAAFLADFIRQSLMNAGISFSMETVMSHPSKLDIMRLAHQKKFRIYLYYVSTESAEINIGRVRTRVKEGGHNVPDEKVRTRYVRSLDNLLEAIKLSNRAYLFDNSGKRYQLVAEYDQSTNSMEVNHLTEWLQKYVIDKI